MRKHLILPIVMAFVSLTCQAGNIYKWQEDGKTVYGEYPPIGADTEQLSRSSAVRINESARPSATKLLEQQEQATKDAATEAEIVADADAYKQTRKSNCATARRNLSMYTAGGRHRFRQPDGSVKYLDEAETQNRIEEANSHIRDFCN
ncbi:MAG: hypothetical protein V3V50_03535 [Gammaproteobacteria bacterium]